jgi:hypothetical protein
MVQLISLVCAVSSGLDVYHSKILLSISMSRNISEIHVSHSLVHCTRGIFLFLHLSLWLSFSSFAIEIILNQFPESYYIEPYSASPLHPSLPLVSYSNTKLGIFFCHCFLYLIALNIVMWHTHTHPHTHTYIYIYTYIYML